MSSVIRSLSQLPSRVKYLLAVAQCEYYIPVGSLESIETTNDFATKTTSNVRPLKTLFRDMGDSVTTVNASGQHVGLYRSVQRVAGISSEGVPETFETETVYVQVWSADTAVEINVVRVG